MGPNPTGTLQRTEHRRTTTKSQEMHFFLSPFYLNFLQLGNFTFLSFTYFAIKFGQLFCQLNFCKVKLVTHQ